MKIIKLILLIVFISTILSAELRIKKQPSFYGFGNTKNKAIFNAVCNAMNLKITKKKYNDKTIIISLDGTVILDNGLIIYTQEKNKQNNTLKSNCTISINNELLYSTSLSKNRTSKVCYEYGDNFNSNFNIFKKYFTILDTELENKEYKVHIKYKKDRIKESQVNSNNSR